MDPQELFIQLIEARQRNDYMTFSQLPDVPRVPSATELIGQTFDGLSSHPQLEKYNAGRTALLETRIAELIFSQDLEPDQNTLVRALDADKTYLAFKMIQESINEGKPEFDMDTKVLLIFAKEYLKTFVCEKHRQGLDPNHENCPDNLYGIARMNIIEVDGFNGYHERCQDFYRDVEEVLRAYNLPIKESMDEIKRLMEKEPDYNEIQDRDGIIDLSPGTIIKIGHNFPQAKHNIRPDPLYDTDAPEEGELFMVSHLQPGYDRPALAIINNCSDKEKTSSIALKDV